MLTKEKKAALIEAYKRKFGDSSLISEQSKLERADLAEQRMVNKLNTITSAVWSVKLKDVLMVERRHQLQLKTLFLDVEKIRKDPFPNPNNPK